MRASLRRIAFSLALAALPAAAALVPGDAQASVSIAVAYEALVQDADAVAIGVPVEQMSVWEDGRIYTYTRVKAEAGVAGDLATGADGWVRTMGGVVGKIGQHVDGEPVLQVGKPSLLFLRHFKPGTYQVSARAQGQFPVVFDEQLKAKKIIRSSAVGVLLPPKPGAQRSASGVTPKTVTKIDPTMSVRLAKDVLHERALDDAVRDIAALHKKLHAAATPAGK
ncbi:MAG: hypothetical protein KC657_13510 [Myxococcales bacterium]|nr:hypothetical protein [Myxococcales bacterium]